MPLAPSPGAGGEEAGAQHQHRRTACLQSRGERRDQPTSTAPPPSLTPLLSPTHPLHHPSLLLSSSSSSPSPSLARLITAASVSFYQCHITILSFSHFTLF